MNYCKIWKQIHTLIQICPKIRRIYSSLSILSTIQVNYFSDDQPACPSTLQSLIHARQQAVTHQDLTPRQCHSRVRPRCDTNPDYDWPAWKGRSQQDLGLRDKESIQVRVKIINGQLLLGLSKKTVNFFSGIDTGTPEKVTRYCNLFYRPYIAKDSL